MKTTGRENALVSYLLFTFHAPVGLFMQGVEGSGVKMTMQIHVQST